HPLYTLSLHDALPICLRDRQLDFQPHRGKRGDDREPPPHHGHPAAVLLLWGLVYVGLLARRRDRAAGGLGVPPIRLCRAVTRGYEKRTGARPGSIPDLSPSRAPLWREWPG